MKTFLFKIKYLLGVGLLFVGCDYVKPKQNTSYVARINDNYLSREEIRMNIPKNMSHDDSVLLVQNYINLWATKQLLLEGAMTNLPQEKQSEYNNMVKEYRQELFTQAYKDMLIAEKMDTVISQEQIDQFFGEHKEKYKLEQDILKFRYIELSEDYEDISKVKEAFKEFNEEDFSYINDKIILDLESYFFNDSLWIPAVSLFKRIKLLDYSKRQDYLKKDTFFEVKDTNRVYFIYIKDVLPSGEEVPRSYLNNKIKQIILNKRKLQFEKELEKRILDDAIQKNQFETYKYK